MRVKSLESGDQLPLLYHYITIQLISIQLNFIESESD